MPIKRRLSKAKLAFDYSVAVHLVEGSCYLAGENEGCGCGIVDEHGVYREDLALLFRREFATVISAVEGGARELEVRKMLRSE